MGGIEVDESMETCVKGLFAAGECVGGANGANRLSGNAIPEAFVFGDIAGASAAKAKAGTNTLSDQDSEGSSILRNEQSSRAVSGNDKSQKQTSRRLLHSLQTLMWENVGVLRRYTKIANSIE